MATTLSPAFTRKKKNVCSKPLTLYRFWPDFGLYLCKRTASTRHCFIMRKFDRYVQTGSVNLHFKKQIFKSHGTLGNWTASILGEKWPATSSEMFRQKKIWREFSAPSCHSIGWSGAILPTKTKNSIRINFVQFARHSKVVEVLHWNYFLQSKKSKIFSFCLTSTNVLFYSDLFCAQMHFFQINSRWFENLAQPLFPDRERSVGWFGKFRLNEARWSFFLSLPGSGGEPGIFWFSYIFSPLSSA